jgi:hypothetical protein
LLIENFQYCKILKGAAATPFAEKIVKTYFALNPNFPLICNSTGLLKFHNLTFIDTPLTGAFPSGFHMMNFHYRDELDSKIFNMTMWGVSSK